MDSFKRSFSKTSAIEVFSKEELTVLLQQQTADLKVALGDLLANNLQQLKEVWKEEQEKTLESLKTAKAQHTRFFKGPSATAIMSLRSDKSGESRPGLLGRGMISSGNLILKGGRHIGRASIKGDLFSKGRMTVSTALQAVSNTAASVSNTAASATQAVGKGVKQGARNTRHLMMGRAGSDENPETSPREFSRDSGRDDNDSCEKFGSEGSDSRRVADDGRGSYRPLIPIDTSLASDSSTPPKRTTHKAPANYRDRNLATLEMSSDESDNEKENSKLVKLVTSKGFDLGVSTVIVFNAVLVGLQTDYKARHWEGQLPIVFFVADTLSCLFFASEMALRLFAFGGKFFNRKHRNKNLFDLACVVAQLIDFGLLLAGDAFHQFVSLSQNLRLLRFFRITHIFRNIPELRHLLSSISHSLKSLLWTMVVLILVVYIVAICITQLVTDTKLKLRDGPEMQIAGEERHTAEDADLLFGTLPRSMISLYAAVSEGLEWRELTEPLQKLFKTSMIDFLCALYMSFMLFAMMNVITGHIVQCAISVAEEDKTKNFAKNLRDVFDRSDEGGTGQIKLEDFKEYLMNDSLTKKFLREIQLDADEAMSVFFYLDKDHTDMVEKEELVQGCIRLRGPTKVSHFLAFMEEFHQHAIYVERVLEILISSWQPSQEDENHEAVSSRPLEEQR